MKNALTHFWRRRVVAPVVMQLTQGITPRHLALSGAIGIALGVFPILGSTTLLCFLAGVFFKLNQPVLQAINYFMYPAQLVLLPVFVRCGEKLFHAKPVPLFPTELVKEFMQGPGPFLSHYGMAGVYGITAWTLMAPVAMTALYFSLVPVFEKMKPNDKGHPERSEG